jgi:DNA polymerase-3 subunit gamma/tau
LVAHLEKICNAEGVKVAKGVLPLVVRASGGSVRDALSILGQLLAGAGSDGVSYEIAIQLLGFTDGALLDDAIDALAARDGASLFKTVDRVIESGHDPRRFTSDFLERLRDLMIVDALQQTNANSILRDLPEDQIERMRTQANQIGAANLSRAADIAAEGLTQMRGATAPRLILELICGRILLPGADTTERGMLTRIERLERADSISTPAPVSVPAVKAALLEQGDSKKALPESPVPDKAAEPKALPESAAPEKTVTVTKNSSIDVTGLRRIWPDVIEEVKKKRRLTWSLLSASAQIVSMDENSITIGIVNPGARDSFLRSESDVILRQAFVDVVGVDKKIEVIVDSSIDTNTPAARAVRVDESPTDKNQLSGPELLARELGAKIVKDDR